MSDEEKKHARPGQGHRITTFSLTPLDLVALDKLVELLKRSNRTDTVRFLIWTALESNFSDVYKEMKGGEE